MIHVWNLVQQEFSEGINFIQLGIQALEGNHPQHKYLTEVVAEHGSKVHAIKLQVDANIIMTK
ncbi:MAG: hypothetical protein RL160_806 [Bacteroidota bacterium]